MTTTVTVQSHGHYARVLQIPHAEGQPNIVNTSPINDRIMAPGETLQTYATSSTKVEVHEISADEYDAEQKALTSAG